MKATLLDLRRNPRRILEALERNETVVLSRRGREIATIVPKRQDRKPRSLRDSPAFGLWKDRKDLGDPSGYVGRIRRERAGGL